MFDKLVASEPESADFKNRRRYFFTSSVVVGILFLAAVVASIFAADFGLGNNGFDLVEMIAPPEMAAPEPETPKPSNNESRESRTDEITREVNMTNMQETPLVPKGFSVTPNTQLARPNTDRFRVTGFDSPTSNPNGSGRSGNFSGDSPSGLSQKTTPATDEPEVDLPPAVKKDPPRRPISKGPLNGEAKYLPKPIYSAAAKAVRAQGVVTVQVTIDEKGNVISANAADGHRMLRSDAERAARAAKFSPTTLGGVPVKVTGVITYNFIL
jgi:protein TonB